MKQLLFLLLISWSVYGQNAKHYEWKLPDSTYKYYKIVLLKKPKWLIEHEKKYEVADMIRRYKYEEEIIKKYYPKELK